LVTVVPDLSAEHYLRIYGLKVGMAEDGTTKPRPEFVEGMRVLVAALAKLDPAAPVRLEATDKVARFIDLGSGGLLAELVLDV
jgi:hypothetical protein